MMTCTPECLEAQRKNRDAVQAYEESYPNYCHSCGGYGAVTWTENASPGGSGEYWPMQCRDACDTCIGQGKCPRCGQVTMNRSPEGDVPATCSACGWDDKAFGHPGSVECPCWMAEPDYF